MRTLFHFRSKFEDEYVLPDLPAFKLYFKQLDLTIRGKIYTWPSIITLTWRVDRFEYSYKNNYHKGTPEEHSEDLVSGSFDQLRLVVLIDFDYQL